MGRGRERTHRGGSCWLIALRKFSLRSHHEIVLTKAGGMAKRGGGGCSGRGGKTKKRGGRGKGAISSEEWDELIPRMTKGGEWRGWEMVEVDNAQGPNDVGGGPLGFMPNQGEREKC